MEGAQPEVEFEETVAEVGGLVAGEPGFGGFEGFGERGQEFGGKVAGSEGRRGAGCVE